MNFTVNTLQDGLIIEELVDISTPPSAYQSIDFNFSLYFNLIKQSTSSISFIVNNITQTKYRDYLNRMRFYADDIGRNFQLQFIFSY
jgi:iron complex outermembrane receptor protein